jgi:hypothetical protein
MWFHADCGDCVREAAISTVVLVSGSRYSQQSQGLPSESSPSIFLFYLVRFDTIRLLSGDIPAIIISHSPSSSIPSGKNILTSPTILHPAISSGESSGCEEEGR